MQHREQLRKFKYSPYHALCWLASLEALSFSSCTNHLSKPDQPNIIMILADDLGYSDLGCYGSEIQTPNLDKLAKEGLLYTQMYSCGRCWPSRSALLTGHYPRALNVDPLDTAIRNPSWVKFIPQYLKQQGYRSYHSGKWHVFGYDIGNAGFEHYYHNDGCDRNFTPDHHFLDGDTLPQPSLSDRYYSSINITDYLIGFLKHHQKENPRSPFFGYLSFVTPHFPLQALPEDVELYRDTYKAGWDIIRDRRYRRQIASGIINCVLTPRMPEVIPEWNLRDEKLQSEISTGELGKAVAWEELTQEQKMFQSVKMSIHAAMVSRIDQEIGRLIDELKKMGVYNNTVIMFASDNGASAEQIIRGDMHDKEAAPGSAATYLCLGPGWSTCSNTPFRRHKYWMDEGGIASPFIISWPEGITEKGEYRTTVCHFIDILPTILELAGIEVTDTISPTLPGKSLCPVFDEDKNIDRSPLYFDHWNNKALRDGKWKLLSAYPENRWELFDMETDRSECHDLANKYPEIAGCLIEEWNSYSNYLDSLKNEKNIN